MTLLESKHKVLYLGSFQDKEDVEFEFYRTWLEQSMHAEMKYLEQYKVIRQKPLAIHSEAKQITFFAMMYSNDNHSLETPKIAAYALGRDYHSVFKKKLEEVYADLVNQQKIKSKLLKVLVDTGPILERSLANHSSSELFRGKNTLSIHRKLGSFFLIGSWVLDSFWHPDENTFDEFVTSPKHQKKDCGTCKRCQVHCPTGALSKDYVLDANKCLSYWTIEHRGTIPPKYWRHLKDYWYGCDVCQNVCPFNKGIKREDANSLVDFTNLNLKHHLNSLDLKQVATMDQKFYESNFGGTALTRAKRSGLRRNALIAMFASSDPLTIETARTCSLDDDPVVKETASEILTLSKHSTTQNL